MQAETTLIFSPPRKPVLGLRLSGRSSGFECWLCVRASSADRGAARRGEVCSVGEGQLFTRGFEVRRESCAEGSQADFWPFRPQEGSLLPSFLALRWADASAHSFLQLLQSFLLQENHCTFIHLNYTTYFTPGEAFFNQPHFPRSKDFIFINVTGIHLFHAKLIQSRTELDDPWKNSYM